MGRIISACNTRFRVISVLGEGSYGTVYRAIQSGTGDIVAIKVVKTEKSAEKETQWSKSKVFHT